MSHRRRPGWVVATVVVVLAALLGGCVDSVTGAARRTGYVVVGLAEAPDSLDPTMSSTFVGRIVFANMCEKLYDVDAHLNVVPQLAANLPQISGDGLVYTIPLRQGIRFNDGTPLNAAAVVDSLQRDRTDKLSQRKSELTSVANVSAVDDRTVRITLRKRFAPLLSVLADRSGMVMSPTALRQEGDKFGQHPVCVGPFSFESRPTSDEINLKRSPDYYDAGSVALAGITFRVITEATVRATDIRSGDIDVVDRAGAQDLQTLKSDPSLRTMSVTSLGYQGITINIGNAHGTDKPTAVPQGFALAASVPLRKAFELSIDRDVINKVVFEGTNTPDCSPLPAGTYHTNVPCTSRNIAAAKELIRQAGVATPIPVQLTVANTAESEQLGTIIQAMAKDAGFDVSLQPTEFATALSRAMAGQFQTFQTGWSGRLDPDQNISPFVLPGSALNYSGANDPQFNDLIAKARATTDVTARKALYHELVIAMNDKLPIIYLYHENYNLVFRDSVSGVQFYGDGLIRLGHARTAVR